MAAVPPRRQGVLRALETLQDLPHGHSCAEHPQENTGWWKRSAGPTVVAWCQHSPGGLFVALFTSFGGQRCDTKRGEIERVFGTVVVYSLCLGLVLVPVAPMSGEHGLASLALPATSGGERPSRSGNNSSDLEVRGTTGVSGKERGDTCQGTEGAWVWLLAAESKNRIWTISLGNWSCVPCYVVCIQEAIKSLEHMCFSRGQVLCTPASHLLQCFRSPTVLVRADHGNDTEMACSVFHIAQDVCGLCTCAALTPERVEELSACFGQFNTLWWKWRQT